MEAEWLYDKDGSATLTQNEVERCKGFFTDPDYQELDNTDQTIADAAASDLLFSHWLERNVAPHKKSGYRIVNLCLKETGVAPGDITDTQMEFVADLADKYSLGEVRVTHEQNLVLTDVRLQDLYTVYLALKTESLATPYLGLLNDIVCCPGGDFCSLANAKSIPIAESIQRRFEDFDVQKNIGEITLNISGCMNACGHHHVGNIGILGVDKKGAEFYQVTLGGSADRDTSLGKVLGPSFAQSEMPDVIDKIINVYLENRQENENFLATYNRIGMEPYKEKVYANAD